MDEATRLFLGILLIAGSVMTTLVCGVFAICMVCEPYNRTFTPAEWRVRYHRACIALALCTGASTVFVFMVTMAERGAW